MATPLRKPEVVKSVSNNNNRNSLSRRDCCQSVMFCKTKPFVFKPSTMCVAIVTSLLPEVFEGEGGADIIDKGSRYCCAGKLVTDVSLNAAVLLGA